MERFGSGWSEPLYTVSTVGWEPTVRALEINDLQCVDFFAMVEARPAYVG